MGDWRVRLRYHVALGTHKDVGQCEERSGIPGCDYVVEEHQMEYPPQLKPPVPEFDVEIRYLTGSPGIDFPSAKQGWCYVISWTDRRGSKCADRDYGYQTEAKAKEAAEHRARAVALAMVPAVRYKYRPEA